MPGLIVTDNVILGAVFSVLAGIVSSINPCALAGIPIVVAHAAAVEKHRRKTYVLMFVFGMVLALSVVGVFVGLIGKSILFAAPWLRWVAGIAFLTAGFSYLGLFRLSRTCEVPILSQVEETPENLLNSPKHKVGDLVNSALKPLAMGMMYGLSSSPCSTPMFVAILSIAASSGSFLRGGILFFGYSLGQSLLVALAGVFTSVFLDFLENERGVLVIEVIRKIGGIVIAGFGGYLLIRPYV
ncbi:MAG: sulfite exporter TauE/SafE family protein [Firmicutes bacterium]|nr:sulfite exporter TauE/SafE family protein [Candidatus Fermentithermobacillaceae bacterium]HOV65389.1 cytochrome c biogenesis protein CcdA [Bacillota bacterium]HRC53307.1 cytochrome c biogenesis protein CcdA [Bacillota bacterium]